MFIETIIIFDKVRGWCRTYTFQWYDMWTHLSSIEGCVRIRILKEINFNDELLEIKSEKIST